MNWLNGCLTNVGLIRQCLTHCFDEPPTDRVDPTQERYSAWGHTFKNYSMLTALVLDIAAGAIAIGEIYIDDDDESARVGLAVTGFTLLCGGILSQIINNCHLRNQIARLRERDGDGNAIGTEASDAAIAFSGFGVGCAGMVVTWVKNSKTGEILTLVAPLIALAGFSFTTTRYEEELKIINDRLNPNDSV